MSRQVLFLRRDESWSSGSMISCFLLLPRIRKITGYLCLQLVGLSGSRFAPWSSVISFCWVLDLWRELFFVFVLLLNAMSVLLFLHYSIGHIPRSSPTHCYVCLYIHHINFFARSKIFYLITFLFGFFAIFCYFAHLFWSAHFCDVIMYVGFLIRLSHGRSRFQTVISECPTATVTCFGLSIWILVFIDYLLKCL